MNDRCQVCNAELATFDVIDPESGNQVDTEVKCPNAWNMRHYHTEVSQ